MSLSYQPSSVLSLTANCPVVGQFGCNLPLSLSLLDLELQLDPRKPQVDPFGATFHLVLQEDHVHLVWVRIHLPPLYNRVAVWLSQNVDLCCWELKRLRSSSLLVPLRVLSILVVHCSSSLLPLASPVWTLRTSRSSQLSGRAVPVVLVA